MVRLVVTTAAVTAAVSDVVSPRRSGDIGCESVVVMAVAVNLWLVRQWRLWLLRQ